MRKFVFLSCVTLAFSAACSSTPTTPEADSGTDSGTPQDSGKDVVAIDSGNDSGGQDAGTDGDAGPQPINGCTSFVDLTATDAGIATITGPGALALPAQYTPNCVKIKVGSSVKWNSGFTGHPLIPSTTGDKPTPIVATSTGTTVTFAFPTKGTYGFECQFHGGLTMFGAVQVVP